VNKHLAPPADPRSERGFTLIEITFAIVILAGSLVVLLGLQSASTQASIRDAQKQRAVLAARALMSAIEVGDPEVEVQDTTAPMSELLADNLPGNLAPPAEEGPRGPTAGLTGRLKVEFWQLPGMDPEVVKRVSLRVMWSDSPIDAVEILYFLPTGEEAPPEDSLEDE